MKINTARLNPDMLGDVSIPVCPEKIRVQAQNIVMLIHHTEPVDYQKMTQYYDWLTLEYWVQYDGLALVLAECDTSPEAFREWYLRSATKASVIERALRWLIEKGYLYPRPEVWERAHKASEKYLA